MSTDKKPLGPIAIDDVFNVIDRENKEYTLRRIGNDKNGNAVFKQMGRCTMKLFAVPEDAINFWVKGTYQKIGRVIRCTDSTVLNNTYQG